MHTACSTPKARARQRTDPRELGDNDVRHRHRIQPDENDLRDTLVNRPDARLACKEARRQGGIASRCTAGGAISCRWHAGSLVKHGRNLLKPGPAHTLPTLRTLTRRTWARAGKSEGSELPFSGHGAPRSLWASVVFQRQATPAHVSACGYA